MRFAPTVLLAFTAAMLFQPHPELLQVETQPVEQADSHIKWHTHTQHKAQHKTKACRVEQPDNNFENPSLWNRDL